MKIIVTAGGTGGHIFPALAIINKIKEKEPDSEILYIGTTDRMEKDIIPKAGIDFIGIKMMGLNRKNILKNIDVITSLKKAIDKSKEIIKKFNPDIVIGVGGYITFPVIYAANKLGYKTFIHEQNSIAGLSNKILKNKVNKIGVSLEYSKRFFPNNKTIFTGNPRSEEVFYSKSASKTKYGLSKDKKLVLVVMGSLGSYTINNIMKEIIQKFDGKDYEVLLVTGKRYYENYKNVVIPKNVKLIPFIDDMPGVLKITDLIITRAGASTIAEITALGLPSIMIPSPYVTHNHQYKNAKVLKNAGASILIEEKNLSSDILINNIDEILNNKTKYDIMSKRSKDLAVNNSATKIYEILRQTIDGD